MNVVVERLRLAPGEQVFGVGLPGLFVDLPAALARAVEANGGVYVGTLGAIGPYGSLGDADFREAAVGLDREGLRELLRDVPVGVMLPGTSLADAPYGAMADLLGEGLGEHRAIHFHWGGRYDVESRSIPVGAEAAAQPSDDPTADSLYRTAITTIDYDALAAAQAAFEEAARAGEIHVTTPAGTDLRFRIGDRPVNRQDGDASAERARRGRIIIDREIEFPSGALRVAPVETTVSGLMVFPKSRWNGGEVENLTLTIEEGRIVGIEASSGVEAARAELDAAGESAAFRELAVGFNPLLAVPEEDPWLPYFGYGAGVVRLSLGDNSELGGTVGGGYVRWIFVLDATVTIDGATWVSDGRLTR
ncbi:MAG: aminopeptidase [Gemmatimonadota bacterium]|nr:aminopeptidase [Gemmatimonadota bacterium]